jgi:hypothetical protein
MAPPRRERITAAHAALIVGVSARKILALAANGEIPGCAKVGKTPIHIFSNLTKRFTHIALRRAAFVRTVIRVPLFVPPKFRSRSVHGVPLRTDRGG